MTETADHTSKKPDFNGPDIPPPEEVKSNHVTADTINDAYYDRRDNGPCGG